MLIKLIAPFTLPFKINNSYILQENAEYHNFWIEVKKNCEINEAVTQFLHAEEGGKLVFTTIKKSTKKNRAEVINLKYKEDYLKKIIQYTSYAVTELYVIDKDELIIKIYSNGIGIIETAIIIKEDSISRYGFDFEKIQELSNNMIVDILDKIYKDSLIKLIDNINSVKHHQKNAILTTDNVKSFNYAKPRWVNRTLFVEITNNKDSIGKILKNWIIVDNPDKVIDELKHERAYYIDWGHNIVNTLILDELDRRQLLDTISIAQFFYTVLYDTNNYLSSIFSEIEKEITLTPKQLKNRLENDVLDVELFLCLFNDTYLTLQGQSHNIFPFLNKCWHIDIIIDSIYKKLKLCKEKIERYHRNYIRKSQVSTEMILLLIGSINLFALFVDLSNLSLNIQYTPYLYELLREAWVPGIFNVSILLSPNELFYLSLAIFFFILFFYKRVLRSKYDE